MVGCVWVKGDITQNSKPKWDKGTRSKSRSHSGRFPKHSFQDSHDRESVERKYRNEIHGELTTGTKHNADVEVISQACRVRVSRCIVYSVLEAPTACSPR